MLQRSERWFQETVQKNPIPLWLFFAGNVALYAGLYVAINEWSFHRGIWFGGIALALDYHIPFVPEFIGIYALLYFVPLALYLLLLRRPELFSYVVGFQLLAFVHYIVFLTYPVQNDLRPLILEGTLSPALAACRFFYDIDRPYNLFPSMHVSIVVYSAAFLWRIRHRLTTVFAILAALIFLSTLFTKQHYFLDGLVGAILGAAMVFAIRKPGEQEAMAESFKAMAEDPHYTKEAEDLDQSFSETLPDNEADISCFPH